MIFTKRIRALALLCAATLLFSACGGGGGSSDTTSSGSIDTPGSTDPTGTSSTTAEGTEQMTESEQISIDIELPGDDVLTLPLLSLGTTPDHTDGIGGAYLPSLEGTAAAGTPVIGELTDMTYPNETLAIVGDNLKGAGFVIWTEGKLKAVEPFRTDVNKAQVLIPSDMTKSTTILWPYNDNGFGTPVRINAPDVYFFDPANLTAGESEQLVNFYGSGLFIEGYTPVVYVKYADNSTELAEIVEANPYKLTVKVKKAADKASCEFYLHNGTGGAYGWSKAQSLSVTTSTILPANELPIFKVSDYDAIPNDGKDDLAGIRRAIFAASGVGGGVIVFDKGEYTLSSTLIITAAFPKGLYFKGAGIGTYDPSSKLDHDKYNERGLSGDYTLLRFHDHTKAPNILIQVKTSNVFFTDMTINSADTGHAHAYGVFIGGENISFDTVRFVRTDLRDFAPASSQLATATALEIDNYSKNITVKNCEFHIKASAINIGNIEGIWPWGFFDSSRTVRNTRIIDCDFYGYAGPYTAPDGRKPSGDLGEISRALTGFNLEGLVFENNTVQGYDRKNNKLMVRTIYLMATCEKTYIANNTISGVGNTDTSGFDLNTGEQILIHGNDFTGGIFNVTESSGNTVTVRTDNINNSGVGPYESPTNAGSYVYNGLDKGNKGALYVYSGKGVGQTRTVVGYKVEKDRIIFELEEPFAVMPDETSIVDLISYSEQNIIYKNNIKNEEVIKANGLKTGGVLLFFQNAYNVIAENEFANLSFGVAINTRFKGPCMWNTVRDNSFSGITEKAPHAAQGGDSTYNAAAFCVSVVANSAQGWDDYNAYYTVGNVFRNNTVENCDFAVELTTNRWHRNPAWYQYFGEEKGAAMNIVENNTFTKVGSGILMGNPDYWSLLRNNEFTFATRPGFQRQQYIYEQSPVNFKVLVIENNTVRNDPSGTANIGGGQSTDVDLG